MSELRLSQVQRAVVPPQHGLQNAINQLEAVLSSKVVLTKQGDIKSIHVMAAPHRAAKRIVRDIESLLLVAFGIHVDYRKISLVQLEEQSRTPGILTRPQLRWVRCQIEGEAMTADVVLEEAGLTYQGRVSVFSGATSPEALAAQATLKALISLTDPRLSLRLQSLTRVQLGELEALVVLLALTGPNEEELLIGASLVGTRPEETSVQAVLNATTQC